MRPCGLSIGDLFASSHEIFSGVSDMQLENLLIPLFILISEILFQLMQKAFSFAMVYYNVR